MMELEGSLWEAGGAGDHHAAAAGAAILGEERVGVIATAHWLITTTGCDQPQTHDKNTNSHYMQILLGSSINQTLKL